MSSTHHSNSPDLQENARVGGKDLTSIEGRSLFLVEFNQTNMFGFLWGCFCLFAFVYFAKEKFSIRHTSAF